MTITHIVAFKFPTSLEAEKVDGFLRDFLALKQGCVRQGKAYIADIKGGRDVSIEGMGKGYDISVVVTFANAQDRDYYVKEDPVHADFATKVKAAVEDAFVFDFEQ